MMSKEYYIPFELQIEIIKRLPIKSLLKFGSVSKPWKSIINTSEFISDYNNNHAHHYNPHQLLIGFNDDNKNVYILDDDNNSLPLLKYSLTVPISLKPSWIGLIGYSQGLFGFYTYPSSVVVIWNPSIRKSVDIHVPNVFVWPYKTVFGFWVCNATGPMIVKINFIDWVNTTRNFPWQVEVFTLSTRVWRSLSIIKCMPVISLRLTPEVVLIDKFMYWIAVRRYLGDFSNLILSFDVTCEEFKRIYLPPILATSISGNLMLSKLRESLVVLSRKNKCDFDVWMLEDGVENSFIRKLYTVKKPNASIQKVIGFRNNGQYIIQRSDNDEARVFAYDLNIEGFKDIGISGIKDLKCSCFVGSYTGTLLLLDY